MQIGIISSINLLSLKFREDESFGPLNCSLYTRQLSKNYRERISHKIAAMADSSAKNSPYFLEPFPSDTPAPAPTKTPRRFGDGAVGLGIVAAMIGGAPDRSGPIPIVYRWAKPTPSEEEAYTCVTSHVPGRPANTRVYLDGAGADAPPMNWSPPPPLGGFLSRCCLCGKDLYGLDLFMYRGDEAFCSPECRSQQIMSDELLEKCGSEAAMMTKAPHFDCSLPPCSAPLFFASGVAAA